MHPTVVGKHRRREGENRITRTQRRIARTTDQRRRNVVHYRHLVALRTHIAVEVHHIQRHRIYPHTHLARRRHKVRGIYTTVVARLYMREGVAGKTAVAVYIHRRI